jgi:hypothetical protein
MDQEEKPNQKVDQKNIRKDKLRQVVFSAAKIFAVIASIRKKEWGQIFILDFESWWGGQFMEQFQRKSVSV